MKDQRNWPVGRPRNRPSMKDPRRVTIWCSGSEMTVDRRVAAAHGLEHGSRIESGSKLFWDLLAASCDHQTAEIQEEMRALRHGPS